MLSPAGLCLNVCARPKIQRLVTPVRLQRRRHLRAIKRHRIERGKEQKAEYEYAKLVDMRRLFIDVITSVLLAKRVADKKAKAAAIKASHQKTTTT